MIICKQLLSPLLRRRKVQNCDATYFSILLFFSFCRERKKTDWVAKWGKTSSQFELKKELLSNKVTVCSSQVGRIAKKSKRSLKLSWYRKFLATIYEVLRELTFHLYKMRNVNTYIKFQHSFSPVVRQSGRHVTTLSCSFSSWQSNLSGEKKLMFY